MHTQTYSKHSGFRVDKSQYVQRDGEYCVQRMKTNTATRGVVNWLSQQVIQVDEQARQQHCVGL
jgi:hypothetical protein